MTATPPGGGLRKRRTDTFVRVPSATVRDVTVSFRALGVLTYLLDKPDGWEVRAEQMANEGKEHPDQSREGREAVRTALRELARAGYYRLERRRLRDGRVLMGTAISDTPVESWAEQARFFDGKAVPVVEQSGGSFLVRYPDGTLQPDDFPPPDTGDGFLGSGTGDVFSGAGTEDGFPGPGFPAPGEPAPGNTSPLEDRDTDRDTGPSGPQDYRPSDHSRSTPKPAPRRGKTPGPGQVQPTLTGEVPAEPAPRQPTTHDQAYAIARAWVEHRRSKGMPIVMRGAKGDPTHAIASAVKPALEAGYTDDEIRKAIADLAQGIPSTNALDMALARRRAGGQLRPVGSKQPPANVHHDERAKADNPFLRRATSPPPAPAAALGGVA